MNNDFNSLNVGDKVISFRPNEERIETVVRKTKTMIITENKRYRISDGVEIGRGGSWAVSILRIGTAEEMEAIKRKNSLKRMRYKIESQNWENVPDEKLEKIYNILID